MLKAFLRLTADSHAFAGPTRGDVVAAYCSYLLGCSEAEKSVANLATKVTAGGDLSTRRYCAPGRVRKANSDVGGRTSDLGLLTSEHFVFLLVSLKLAAQVRALGAEQDGVSRFHFCGRSNRLLRLVRKRSTEIMVLTQSVAARYPAITSLG